MRYCCRCGNTLSVGASFCHCCGAPLKTPVPEAEDTPIPAAEPAVEIAAEPVVEVAAEPAVEVVDEAPVASFEAAPAAEEPAPVAVSRHNEEDIKEEKEFLDQTHQLLRWERKALRIESAVLLGMSIGLVVMFFLIGIIAGIASEEVLVFVACCLYALEFGILLLPIGIVARAASNRIPQYTDTLYKDFRAAYARCGSIGMIVFNYFFSGGVAIVFFIINFVRMKCNKKLIDRILARQGVQ